MEIKTEKHPNYVVMHISGSLSNDELLTFRNGVEAVIAENDTDFIFDFKNVIFICSSALSLLFIFMNTLKSKNRRFLICSLREDIQKLFVITGVDRQISLYNSVKEAAASVA